MKVEGTQQQLETFLLWLKTENLLRSHIQNLETHWLKPKDFQTFKIIASIQEKKTG